MWCLVSVWWPLPRCSNRRSPCIFCLLCFRRGPPTPVRTVSGGRAAMHRPCNARSQTPPRVASQTVDAGVDWSAHDAARRSRAPVHQHTRPAESKQERTDSVVRAGRRVSRSAVPERNPLCGGALRETAADCHRSNGSRKIAVLRVLGTRSPAQDGDNAARTNKR